MSMKIEWNNPASVTSALTAILGAVVAIVATVHPGFSLPASVQASLGAVGVIVAGAAGIAHTWHLTKIHAAHIAAGTAQPSANTPAS